MELTHPAEIRDLSDLECSFQFRLNTTETVNKSTLLMSSPLSFHVTAYNNPEIVRHNLSIM